MLEQSPQLRRTLYTVGVLVGVTLGAIQIGFSAAGHGDPVWLKVCFAVYGFLSASFHLTAATNVPNAPQDPPA
jgi:hypothetical protein